MIRAFLKEVIEENKRLRLQNSSLENEKDVLYDLLHEILEFEPIGQGMVNKINSIL